MRILLLPFRAIKSGILMLVISLQLFGYSNAQIPELELHSMQIDTLKFGLPQNVYMEIPTWTIEGGWHTYFISTFFSKSISSEESLNHPLDQYIDLSDDYGPRTVTTPDIWSHGYLPNKSALKTPWKKNYNGVFTAQVLQHPKMGEYIMAFSHGEHKNERIWHNGKYHYYQNQIIATPIDPNNADTYSGFRNNGVYFEHWDSYFGFLNGNWIQRKGENGWGNKKYHDIGPVIWPSNGLVDKHGNKASWGLRHPSSIIHDNYMYLYYMDTSGGSKPGRRAGIKLARVHVDSTLIPSQYKVYFEGQWLPSLPKNFEKERLLAFKAKKGGKSSRILETFNSVRFSVAKVKGQNLFLGVQQHMDEGHSKVVIRASEDLINWTEPLLEIQDDLVDSYHFSYPIFLDKSGWTNTEIDLDDFFILGQTDLNKTIRIRLRLNTPNQTSALPKSEFDLIEKFNHEVINVAYPVPADDFLVINYHANHCSNAEIRDVFGNLVWQGALQPDQTHIKIATDYLGNGVYYFVAAFQGQTATKTFTISR